VHQNLFLRVRALASQPFIADSPGAAHRLGLLGSHDYGEIEDYLRANRLADARTFARDAVAIAPSSVEALAERGRVELVAGSPQAQPYLEQSLNAWPKLSLPAVLLCQYFMRAGDTSRSVQLLREASRRDPNDAAVLQLQRLFAQKRP
jgi:predicted Zn-dependent protease